MKKIMNDKELAFIKSNYGIMKTDDIADKLNINRKTLYRIIKEQNIIKNTTELDIESVKQDYLVEFLTIKEIAEKYNVAPNYVITFLNKNNIKKTKEEIEESKKVTNKKRYGCEWATQNKELYSKIRQTNIERYGVDNPHRLESVIEKTKQTFIKKYGVDNYQKTQEGKDKIHNRAHHRSVKFYLSNTNIKNQYIDIWMDDAKFSEYVTSNSGITISQISLLFGMSYEAVCARLDKLNLKEHISLFKHSSRYEDEICEILDKYNIQYERNNKEILDGKEIDIYIPNSKIGIEFNGNYWHCEAECTNTYHQNKSLLANEKGVFIYNIFEYEWVIKKEKILNQLFNLLQLNTNKIYARKCEIRLVSKEDKDKFLDNNHIQGKSPSKINLGLYFNDELVSLMTFGISRFNKNCRYELIRFCSKGGTNVVGGANKLFKYFVNQYMVDGDKLVSYSDIARTRGTLYETLGFEYSGMDYPNYVWWNLSTKEIKTRYQCQIKNEIDTMHNLGYLRIFDCGAKTWIYTK